MTLYLFTANNVGTHRRQISDLLDQSIQVNAQCFVITADNRFILLCGFWDKSFRVYSTDTGNRDNPPPPRLSMETLPPLQYTKEKGQKSQMSLQTALQLHCPGAQIAFSSHRWTMTPSRGKMRLRTQVTQAELEFQ